LNTSRTTTSSITLTVARILSTSVSFSPLPPQMCRKRCEPSWTWISPQYPFCGRPRSKTMDKDKLRRILKQERGAVPKEKRDAYDRAIWEHLTAWEGYLAARRCMTYLSFG